MVFNFKDNCHFNKILFLLPTQPEAGQLPGELE